MQVHDSEGLATHTGPESCVYAREGESEALTGERIGQPLSGEKFPLGCRCSRKGRRQHGRARERECLSDPASSETLACTYAF